MTHLLITSPPADVAWAASFMVVGGLFALALMIWAIVKYTQPPRE